MRCIRDGIDSSVVDDELCLGVQLFVRPLAGVVQAVGTIEVVQELDSLLRKLLVTWLSGGRLSAQPSERCHELVEQVPGGRVGSIAVQTGRNVLGAQLSCQLHMVDKITPMLGRCLIHVVESEVAVFFAV